MKTETRVGVFIIVAIGIFFYLSFNIGEIRFDGQSFVYYRTFFDDTGGLEEKSSVKIAGVTVGWVDAINLLDGGRAEIVLRVKKTHRLSRNAYATISQDGLIGSKTIEVDPGDPATGVLPPGSQLAMPGKSPATVSDLLESLREITDSVQDVVSVFKGVFATPKGESLLQNTLDNVSEASERISDFSNTIERTMSKNEDKLDSIISHLKISTEELSQAIPDIRESVTQAGTEATKTLESFGETAHYATETFKGTELVARRINDGDGTLGKLINDSELHKDIHDTVKGVKGFIGKARDLTIDLDLHFENYLRNENSRGALDACISTFQDYFYNIQISADDRGQATKSVEYNKFFNSNDKELDADHTSGMSDYEKGQFLVARKETIVHDQSKPRIGFQFGRRFDYLTFRVGLFENTFGVACDYKVPLDFESIKWRMSLEAFDFKGYNRFEDDRPHLRWTNRVFFMNHFYTTFGLEDICSRKDASPFWGTGLSFNDDDIKYMFSMLSLGKLGG